MEMILEVGSVDGYKYDLLKLDLDKLVKLYKGDQHLVKSKRKKRWRLDCVFVHYLVKELSISNFYRKHFMFNLNKLIATPEILVLCPSKVDLIDYNWNNRIYHQIRERCELDHALSWLSTLGGAFSALGDYFEKCADTAAKISIHQFKLALKLGDPNIASRCRLYLSISLIQKKRFKVAKKIIENEYRTTRSEPIVDQRLLKMCQGIWAKLRYEWEIEKNCCKIKKVKR